MEGNNFFLDLIASLKKGQSKKQIREDAKNLGDIKTPLIGTLNKPKTRAQIKKDLASINATINITGKINKKDIQNNAKQAVNNAQKVANSKKIQMNFDVNKQKLINQIKILGMRNSKLFSDKDMSVKYNQLLDSAKIAKNNADLKGLRGQLSAFRSELIATEKAGMNWSDRFKASISRYAQFFSGATFIYAIANQLRNAATEAKTLDDRLVDLQKVTDEIADRDSLYKYFDKALNKAQDLNVKVDSLLYAITEFKKLGWSLSDAELGGQWATILENVGDVDIDTAIGSIKTSIASFDEIGGYTNAEMDKKLEAYVDLINNMSNKYSIDANGLSEAIRLSAGTLREAHTSIEQAATIFSTANKYFNDPDYLGNTLKIGSLRMRASSGDSSAVNELEKMGEEVDNLTQATSSLREKMLSLTGVDIMVDEHTFKSYYDQLLEISQVIDSLSDTSRANVLETLFGKNRSAGGAAILAGMKESADAYEDAINSARSATKEYETWMQSADAASQRFANNLTEAYHGIINGNTVRDVANIGSAILEFANRFGVIEGTLKGLLALGIGKFLTTMTMGTISATRSMEQYGKALQLVKNIPDGDLTTRNNILKAIAQATNQLTDAQLKQVLSSKALSQQDRLRILEMSGMTKEIATQKLTEMGLTQATNAQTAATVASTGSTFSLKAAMIGLGNTIKSVFLSNPVGIALMGISVAISAITSSISKHNQELEEAREKAKETADAIAEEEKNIISLIDQYNKLDRTDRSTENTEKIKNLNEEINEILGDQAENIDLVNGKLDEQNTKLQRNLLQKLQENKTELDTAVSIAKSEYEKGVDGGVVGIDPWNSVKKALDENGATRLDGSNLTYLDNDLGLLDSDKQLEQLKEWLALLTKADGQTGKYGDELASLQSWYDELAKKQETYNKALETQKLTDAQSKVLNDSLSGKVNSAEAFEEYRNNIKEIYKDNSVLQNQMLDFVDTTFPQYAKTIDESVGKVIESANTVGKGTASTFDKIWNSLDDDDKTKEAKEKLLELAKAGKLTKEAFSKSSIADSFLKSTKLSAEEATQKINELVSSADQLASMKTGISSISSILGQKEENLSNKKTKTQGIGADVLAGIPEEVKAQTKEYEHFIEVLGNGSSTMKDCKEAANKLATAYVTSSNFLSKLTGDNQDYYKSVLKEMGVENAEAIVTKTVRANKEVLENKTRALEEATKDLADGTNESSEKFVKQSKMCKLAKVELADYIAKEEIFNKDNNLSVEDRVKALNNLASAYFKVSGAITIAAGAQDAMKGHHNFELSPEQQLEQLNKQWDKFVKEQTKISVGEIDIKPTSPSGSKNSGKKKNQKKEKQQFDWLERRLTRMQNIIDLTASKLQNLFSVKAKNKNLDKQIKQTTKLLKQYKAAANIYQDKADEIAKGSTKKTKKGKKKKVKGLSKSIIKKIKSGKVTKANHKKLFKGYNESTYNKISQYIDFYDKAQNAKKRVNELTADIHEKTIQKLTNLHEEQDKYAEQYNAEQQNAVLSKRNEYVAKELGAIKKSYDYQIAIAKENEDLIEQAKLKAEKEREIAEAYQQQVDNIKALYDAKRNALDTGIVNSGNGSRRTYGEQYYKNQVDLIESRGLTVGASWYLKQNEIERKKISESNAERNELIKQLQNFKEGTQEWYDLQSDIAECENSIVESQKAINDNSAAVRELKNVINEKKAKYLDDLSNEISFIAGLKHGENTDSDTGTFTNKGNLSAYAEALNTVIGKEGAKQFGEDLQKIEDLYSRKASKAEWEKAGFYGYFNDDGSLNIKAVEEDIDELRKKHQDYIQLQFDSEEKLIDLAKEKYEAQKKYLQDIIDAKKEALDIEKDLYDYERNIADKTKNVANLQKQINALQGDDSEEGRARLAKLQVSLDDAQKDLQDTEYERYISDQQKMLDNLMSEYEDLITNLMKDTDAILLDMLNYIQSGKGNMGDLLFDTAKKYGYVTTDNLLDVVNALSGKEYNIVEDVNGNKHISEVIKAQLNNTGNGSSNTNTSSAPSASTNSNANSKNFIIPQGKDEASKEKERKAVQIRKILTPMVSGMGTSGYWTKAKGKPSSYTNQRILDSNIKKGYVLTESGARAVANTLRGDNGFSFKSGENLTKKTKAQIFSALNTYFKASSFATGGIVDYKPNGEDGLAWVRNGEALVPSEKWEQLASLLDVTPDMKRITDSLVKMPEINHSKAFMEQSIGNVEFTFNMPNVTDPNSFLKEVQSNQKLQKALQEVTLGQTNGNGRLSVNRIR